MIFYKISRSVLPTRIRGEVFSTQNRKMVKKFLLCLELHRLGVSLFNPLVGYRTPAVIHGDPEPTKGGTGISLQIFQGC